ncbi:MAG: diguanylate cyclase [Actinomycetota bacterium]|nr:diguanylate cyclase [Actinomycetota bacterium]
MSKLSGEPRLSPQWWAMLAGSAIVLVAIAVLPVDSIERSMVARGAGLLASLIFVLTFLGLPKSVRSVWFWLGGFLILTAIGDVIYDYQVLILKVSAFPGTADLFYLVSYVFAITGLFILARKLNPGADLSAWIDISIMVVAAAGIVGAFVIAPVWSSIEQWDLTTVLSLLYPLLDLVLLAALVRVLMLPHARSTAITLLAASMGLFLAYDLIYNNQLLAAVWTPVSSMEVLWTAAMLCIPLAALSPGARQFEPLDPSESGAISTTRQLIVGISVMAVPAIVLLELFITGSVILRWLVPVILILLALVLVRVHLLLRASQLQAAKLAEYRSKDFLTGLPSQQTWDEQLQTNVTNARLADGVLTIAILDIDNAEQLRTARGQHVSDLLLVSATIAWLEELTANDVLARYGPDGFALMVQRESMKETQETLRRVVRATPEGLSVSSGAALLRGDQDPVEAQLRAASAMQASRSTRRDLLELELDITS